MPLSREEITQIAKSTAQTVLEGLHRYAVAYKEPETIEQGLQDSMIEERTAYDWYRKRAEHAEHKLNSFQTADLYRHISEEEDRHYNELEQWLRVIQRQTRLQEISGIENPAWVYETVGTTEVRGRKDPGGIEIEQVSSTYDTEDFGKAVELIQERLKSTEPNLWPGNPYNPVTPEVTKIADVNQWAKNMDMFPTEVKFGTGNWRDSKVYGGIQSLLKVLKPGDLVFVRKVTLETTLFYSVENIGGKIEVTDRSFPTEASE